MSVLLAAKGFFPPIDELVVWPDFVAGSTFNKIALINIIAVVLTVGFFLIAGSRKQLVPRGVQNMAEASIDFVRDGIAVPTMGKAGLPWVPMLTAMFFYIFFNNIFGIIPPFQMPATARMATPLVLAVFVWIVFNVVGIVKQGPIHYFGNVLWPRNVPVSVRWLVGIIELISVFLVRPFSMAVRLFANLFAGHLLLVTFAVLANSLWTSDVIALKPVALLPWLMLVLMTLFEVLVSFLQAYIFAMLTGVYIASSMEEHH